MRNNVKRVFSLLLAAALVFSLSLTAFAAEETPLLTLSCETGKVIQDSEVIVSVNAAAADVVADGKLVFTYDSAVLSFEGAQEGAAWPENADVSLQVNGAKLGTVIVAFAGAEAAAAGSVLNLYFTAVDEGQSTVSLSPEDSYITGAGGYTLEGEAQVEVWCPASQFIDVKLSAFYHKGIDYVVSQGYMIGISQELFAPDAVMNRGMLVTVLYRMADAPQVSGDMPFTDVAQGRYYYNAILWASQNGIAKGMTTELFAPNAAVTREQMVTFFARFARFKGISTDAEGDLMDFTDAGQVSPYAVKSMTWAVKTGLIQGMTETTLEPKGNSTRGQVATVIDRFATLILN